MRKTVVLPSGAVAQSVEICFSPEGSVLFEPYETTVETTRIKVTAHWNGGELNDSVLGGRGAWSRALACAFVLASHLSEDAVCEFARVLIDLSSDYNPMIRRPAVIVPGVRQ